ncbi:HAMP domain-containing protein [Mitsuaria sp. WAJ17]|uniref:sensor histidine kinase n=1 Tax=Mitsuaria sp. WAJ17 TaxID=2761452 RepID=UPI001600B16D|nr:ATP-binding protein [Mitsuaria sp. WAJ17]MBB2487919.1 HAMP domain-containing protein [Mitsuaria sp. WAJ17]
MKSLYWRIYLTVIVVLAAFALGAGWLFQRQIEQERGNAEVAAGERWQAMAVLLQRALPPADAPRELQARAIEEWGQRLRMALALQDAQGKRIGASELFERREDVPGQRQVEITLDDGRHIAFIRLARPPGLRPETGEGRRDLRPDSRPDPRPDARRNAGENPERPPSAALLRREDAPWGGPVLLGPRLLHGQGLLIVLVLLFVGIAAGAFPVVRRLTRRLEALKAGVQTFGDGQLSHRVDASGNDEVAAVARSFNEAAGRVETLLRSHQNLLANASHELRSPLARLKMAFAMFEDAGEAQRRKLKQEIQTNIAELDALVEEVLLASRLDSGSQQIQQEAVDVLAVAAEECARSGAELLSDEQDSCLRLLGEERLIRRALRNLLENARRYGGGSVELAMKRSGSLLELRVADRGPGVPQELRERIFEPFYRLPGHAEQAGGVGLGLSLVKQIAQRHGGSVRCEAREGGGSVFVLSLPLKT